MRKYKPLKRLKVILIILKHFVLGQWHLNGKNLSLTLDDVCEKYYAFHLTTVTESTRLKLVARLKHFLPKLGGVPIALLTPERIAEHLKLKKWTYKFKAGSKRYSFQKEIKDIRAILTWWSEHYDFSYKQPVKLFHSQLAVMEPVPEKERVISMEETLKFFKAMEFAQFWHDWVVIAFYCAGRASEIAGIHVGNIDLKERKLKIREVITWISGRPPIVKPFPKNGKARTVYINDTMYEIFERRLKDVPPGCPFLFHNRGKALRYGMILNAVNRGWKDAGLFPKFSGVHQLRYAGAQSARFLIGSIDAAAAVTGHSSIRMAASYSRQDTNLLNQSSVIAMEKSMRGLAPSAAEAV